MPEGRGIRHHIFQEMIYLKHYDLQGHGSKMVKKGKDKEEIYYLSKDEFKEIQQEHMDNPDEMNEPVVRGSTLLKQYDPNKKKKQCDFVVDYRELRFKGFGKTKGMITKGYLDVGDNEYIEYRSNFPILFLIPLFAAVLICMFIFFKPDLSNIDVPFVPTGTGDEWDGQLPGYSDAARADYIEIQGYTKYLLTEEQKNLPLVNAKDNTALLKYSIKLKGEEIYVSDWINPGAAINWNGYDALGKGEWVVTLDISAVDVQTGEPCTGSSQQTTITVR